MCRGKLVEYHENGAVGGLGNKQGGDVAVRKGFTLIELLVVIAIIAILAAILFPVFSKAREKARQAACASNVKQIMLAIQMYAQDYDEMLPFAWDYAGYVNTGIYLYWWVVLQPYVKNEQIFVCPSTRLNPGYVWNYPHMPYRTDPNWTPDLRKNMLAWWKRPAQVMVIADRDAEHPCGWSIFMYCPFESWASAYWTDPYTANVGHHHNGGANVGFLDGHVKWLKIDTIRSGPDAQILWGHVNPD